MYSEAKSTPVRPPGQKATAVIFDPHRPVCPCAPPTPAPPPIQRWHWVPNFCHQTHTLWCWCNFPGILNSFQLEHSFCRSPFFFRKAFLVASGLWRTFGFCRNFTAVLTWKEKSAVSVWARVRSARWQRENEKKKTTGSFQIETHPPTINGFHLIVSSEPPHPVVRKLDHLTTFQLNVGNDQISSYKISPSRVLDKWRMELNLLLRS